MGKRIEWVDLAKGIAILAVIMGHETSGFIKFLIFSFHMPIFFILSGYTSRQRTSVIAVKNTSKKLIKKVLVPAFITVTLVNFQWFFLGKITFKEIFYYIFGGLFWGSASGGPHGHPTIGFMWFLVVFFWAKLLYELVSLYVDDKGQIIFWGIMSLVFIEVKQLQFLPQSFDLVPVAILFMIMGHIIRKDQLIMKCNDIYLLFWIFIWLILLQFGNWIDMGERFYYGGIICVVTACIASFCIMMLSDSLSKLNSMNVLIFLGQNTLLLLCIHYADMYDLLIKHINHLPAISNAAFRLVEDLLIFMLFICFRQWLNKRRKNSEV